MEDFIIPRKKKKTDKAANKIQGRKQFGKPMAEILKDSAERIKKAREGTNAWKVIKKCQ